MKLSAFQVLLVVWLIAVVMGSAYAQELPSFPGAEGWGTTTPGGRGGQVIYVTSLADSGLGTLREAAALTKGPRTIVFAVSGIIHLNKTINIGGKWDPKAGDNPYSFCTIAGQTAPGGGIILAGQDLILSNGVHDVIIRHMRFRDSADNNILLAYDVRNIVIDHCSLSWSTDEDLDMAAGATDVTVSNCILAEGLMEGGHMKGQHSKAAILSRGIDRVSLHHNFLTGCADRNPLVTGGNLASFGPGWVLHPVFDIRNNLVYNYGWGASICYGAKVNMVGNVYVPGPDTKPHIPAISTAGAEDDGTQIYVEDNVDPHLKSPDDQWSMVQVLGRYWAYKPELFRSMEPFPAPAITTVPSGEVAELVLSEVGAWPLDPTDTRLIQEFREHMGQLGGGRTHGSEIPPPAAGEAPLDTDWDGIPDIWEAEHNLDFGNPADSKLIDPATGYSNLELYINSVPVQ